MFYKLFSSISNESGIPSIDWYPSTKCNFRCSYCIRYGNQDFDVEKFNRFKDILNKLEFKINIRILGGEPTLIPNFQNHIQDINKNINLTLVSNSTKVLKDYNRIDNFEFSIHPEYIEKQRLILFENLYLKNVIIILNLHNKLKNNLDKYKKLVDEIRKIKYKNNLSLKFSINPIIYEKYDKENFDYSYFIEFFDFKTHNDLFENNINYFVENLKTKEVKKISYLDMLKIYKLKNNNFKNSFCNMNYYLLEPDYTIYPICFPEKKYNLLEKKLIKKNNYLVCKQNNCDPGCFLEIEKKIKFKGKL